MDESPYSSNLISKFIDKLSHEHSVGNAKQSIVLVNNATETKWAKELMRHSTAICFVDKRIKFLDETGTPKNQPLQGQMIVYRGGNLTGFKLNFDSLGTVLFK